MSEIPTLGKLLESTARKLKKKEALLFEGMPITYQQLDEQANKTANALAGLGIKKGDRVAMMLPNIPEFVYTFFALQKIGAVAVPFNTMYKGREITHILNDSGARAIVALNNFANLINEIKPDVPTLEHIILTGQRTLLFAQPGATVFVQMVFEKKRFSTADELFHKIGEMLVDVLTQLGVKDPWYKHQGSIRAGGKKIASILLNFYENLYIVNAILFLSPLDTDRFFKVIWVPPEVKDKVLEPMTSVYEETGETIDTDRFKQLFDAAFTRSFNAELSPGELKRDELFGYEKTRAIAYRK